METRLVIFLAIIVAVSGCADNSTEKIDNTKIGEASDKGLEIESLGVADDTLTPGQRTTLSLTLKNYHTQPIEVTNITVFNDGQLIIGEDASRNNEDKEPECSPPTIQKASEGVAPEMECTWIIEAPSEEELGAFSSKPMPVNVKIGYESNITNSKPLKLQFRELSEIDSSEPIKKTYSNGEIKFSMEVENPVPYSGRIMYFTAENAGPGNVEGGYKFRYNPSKVFQDCINNYQEKKPVIGSTVEFSCRVQHDVTSVQNLFTSISYKYVKTPTVDIEVVSR